MSKPNLANRVLYVMTASFIAAVALWFGVLIFGLYYFYMDKAIPPIVDHVQVGMLVLAALCGVTSIVMFVWFLVLIVARHRAGPPRI